MIWPASRISQSASDDPREAERLIVGCVRSIPSTHLHSARIARVHSHSMTVSGDRLPDFRQQPPNLRHNLTGMGETRHNIPSARSLFALRQCGQDAPGRVAETGAKTRLRTMADTSTLPGAVRPSGSGRLLPAAGERGLNSVEPSDRSSATTHRSRRQGSARAGSPVDVTTA